MWTTTVDAITLSNTPLEVSSMTDQHARWFSRCCFTWVSPLLRTGACRQLAPEDMLVLDTDLQPDHAGAHLWRSWLKERHNKRSCKPSLLRCLWQLHARPFMLAGLCKAFNDALGFAGPLLIKLLVDWLAQPAKPVTAPAPAAAAAPSSMQRQTVKLAGTTTDEGFNDAEPLLGWLHTLWALLQDMAPGRPLYGVTLSLALGACALARAILSGQYNWQMAKLQAQIRAGLMVTLYSKSLAAAGHQHHETHPSEQHSRKEDIREEASQQPGDDGDTHNKHTAADSSSMVADVNSLVGVDVGAVLNLPHSLHELWSLPLQMTAALVLLYMQVRYAFVAGLLVSIALVPLNKIISQRILAATKDLMAAKDARLSLTSELLRGLRPLRMTGWEDAVIDKIQAHRAAELKALAVHKYLDAGCVYLWAATSLLFTCLTFALVAVLHVPLTAGAAATSFALFQVLIMPLNAIPWVINGVLQAGVSLERVQQYMMQQEHPRALHHTTSCGDVLHTPQQTARMLPRSSRQSSNRSYADNIPASGLSTQNNGQSHEGDMAVVGLSAQNRDRRQECSGSASVAAEFQAAWFTWSLPTRTPLLRFQISTQIVSPLSPGVSGDKDTDADEEAGQDMHGVYCLQDLSLRISTHSFTVVTGQLGSGKSSLLCALLGELLPAAGTAKVPGLQLPSKLHIAYAPQSPWLFSGTIRDNILLHQPLDEARYQQVLDAAALLPDLAGMQPAGDLTRVGERGVQLSGGQRARVALARALYAQTHWLLLDDVLASLDANAAAHVSAALLGCRAGSPATSTTDPTAGASTAPVTGHVDKLTATMSTELGDGGQLMRPALGSLLQGRTVVAVSQSRRWLAAADVVVQLHQGRVVYQGPYLEQHVTQPRFLLHSKVHDVHGQQQADEHHQEPLEGVAGTSYDKAQQDAVDVSQLTEPAQGNAAEDGTRDTEEGGKGVVEGAMEGIKEEGSEEEAEHRSQGVVPASVWWCYLRSVGVWTSWVVLISLIAMQVTKNGADVWVARWVADMQSHATTPPHNHAAPLYLPPSHVAAATSLASTVTPGPAVSATAELPQHGTSSMCATSWLSAGFKFNHTWVPHGHPVLLSVHLPALTPNPVRYLHAVSTAAAVPRLLLLGRNHTSFSQQQLKFATPGSQVGPCYTSTAAASTHSLQSVVGTVTLWGGGSGVLSEVDPSSPAGIAHFLRGLGLIAGLNAVFTLGRAFSFAFAGLQAARRNHVALLSAIAHAPLTYLETIPAGRLLNRFSTDVSRVDDALPFMLNIFLAQSVTLAGLLAVMVYAAPWLMPLIVPMLWVYRRLAIHYRASSRELRRLDAVALSPIYTGFAESKDAAACVRAYGVVSSWLDRHAARVTTHQRAAITGSAASIWLSVRLQLLATFLITSLALITTATHVASAIPTPPPTPSPPYHHHLMLHNGHAATVEDVPSVFSASSTHQQAGTDEFSWRGAGWVAAGSQAASMASLAGLCLAYALPLVGLLEGLVGSGAETEAQMVSMERCEELKAAPRQQDTLSNDQHSDPSTGPHAEKTDHGSTDHASGHRQRIAQKYGSQDSQEALVQPLLGEQQGEDLGDVESNMTGSHAQQLSGTGQVGDFGGSYGAGHQHLPAVELSEVMLRYPGRLTPALSGCSLRVWPGEWVGVVGATGAGKSSLLAVLLRLVEVNAGSVLLSGRDIRSIPLKQLRQHYSVIPQSPFLLSGTVRDNMDPYHQHSTPELVSALKAVQLWPVLLAAATTQQRHPPDSRDGGALQGAGMGNDSWHSSIDAHDGACVEELVLSLRLQGSGASRSTAGHASITQGTSKIIAGRSSTNDNSKDIIADLGGIGQDSKEGSGASKSAADSSSCSQGSTSRRDHTIKGAPQWSATSATAAGQTAIDPGQPRMHVSISIKDGPDNTQQGDPGVFVDLTSSDTPAVAANAGIPETATRYSNGGESEVVTLVTDLNADTEVVVSSDSVAVGLQAVTSSNSFRGKSTGRRHGQHALNASPSRTVSNAFRGVVGLSAGQQQLLCLTRLLLAPRRVVLLDEVTACMDPTSAHVLHQVLKDRLRGNTPGSPHTAISHISMATPAPCVLHVAHQLALVQGYPRVVVMHGGKVVQDGEPHKLSQHADGLFARLVASTMHHM